MSLSSVPSAPMVVSQTARVNVVLRYVVTVVCAGSAGVHAALAPAHLGEGGLGLGAAFAGSAVAMVLGGLAVRRPQHDAWAPAFAAGVLALVAAGYLLSRTTGIPPLIAGPEQVDPLGAVTTVAEMTGAAAGALLTKRRDRA